MNIVAIRDGVKEACKWGAITKREFDAAVYAPVFIWSVPADVSNEDRDWARAEINCGHLLPDRTPFPCLAVNSPKMDKDDVTWLWHEPGTTRWTCLEVVRRTRWAKMGVGRFDVAPKPDGSKKAQVEFQCWANGRQMERKDLPSVGEAEGFFYEIAGFLSVFCMDVMHPNRVVLRQTPAKNGKSVQWQLGHSHYTVLNHHQAQRCQQQRRGPSSEELVRAAHWRRAHFRTLRSVARFGPNAGKRVPVRRAWVGPEEWQGLDDKCYKLVRTNAEIRDGAPEQPI